MVGVGIGYFSSEMEEIDTFMQFESQNTAK